VLERIESLLTEGMSEAEVAGMDLLLGALAERLDGSGEAAR
jgi:hypothetical protein